MYMMGVRASVHPIANSNIHISEIQRLIVIIFDLKQHWGEGKVASGFGSDRIRALMSMVTNCYHRFIMGKILLAL